MKQHGNRSSNPRPHFLYLIYDYFKRRIYKFGIGQHGRGSAEYDRLKRQVWELNRPEFPERRFRGRVLKRRLAKPIVEFWERLLVLIFQHKHGEKPDGNKTKRDQEYSRKEE